LYKIHINLKERVFFKLMSEQLKIELIKSGITVYNITPQNQHLLKIPENIDYLYIEGYYLDHFSIPQGIKYVQIKYLGLKTLYIPDGVISVDCYRNFLQTIEIPQSLITLKANKNLLNSLTFRSTTGNQLEFLDIRSNKLTLLEFDGPDPLVDFNTKMNKINFIAPKIRNYLSMQHLPAPSSPDSSDDEYSPLNFHKPFIF